MALDHARAKSLFLVASDIQDFADRNAFLDRECGTQPELRQRVEALLQANEDLPANSRPDDATTAHSPNDIPLRQLNDGSTLKIGEVIAGRYKLIEEIGAGGMGSVYLAQQTEPVKRSVALKVIKAGMDSKAVLARFDAERQALAMMDHPNIARVLDAGSTEKGQPFFVMELVKGIPITQYCDEQKLTPRQRLELFVPVCHAIQHAHQKGVIHRDIKPSNVLIALYDDRPVPKVIDFGVAKATGTALTDESVMTGFGAVIGTPEYMSPEQASLNNLDIDTRSDVYSLGVLLYELLTGSTPVDRNSLGKAALLEVLRIVREVDAPKLSTKLSGIKAIASVAANRGMEPSQLSRLMKGDLDWVVLKALEKDRGRRYETANGLARDIQRYLADEVVDARSPTYGYRLWKGYCKHRLATWTAAAFLLLILCATGIGFSLAIKARNAERIAMIARDDAMAAERIQLERADGEQRAKETALVETQKAKRQTEIAEAVRSFLEKDIIAQSNPLNDGLPNQPDPELKLKTALDRAEKQIASRFDGKPLIEASIRRALGKAYVGRGMFAEAMKQMELASNRYLEDQSKNPATPVSEEFLETMMELIGLQMTLADKSKVIANIDLLKNQISKVTGHDAERKMILESLTSMRDVADGKETSPEIQKHLNNFRQWRGRFDNLSTDQSKAAQRERNNPFQELDLFTKAMKLMAAEQYAEADAAMIQLISALPTKTGPQFHMWIAIRGSILQKQGRIAEALEILEASREGLKKALGDDHPNLLACRVSLVEIYLKQEKYNQAENELRAILKYYEQRLPNDLGKYGFSLQLGTVLLAQKKYTDAEPLLLATYKSWKTQAANQAGLNIRLPEVIDVIIKLYTETNKNEELKKWQTERAKYPYK